MKNCNEQIKIPMDFYFNNKNHFANSILNQIKNKGIVNVNAIRSTICNFADILFDFSIDNIDKIVDLNLLYPTGVYILNLQKANDLNELLEQIKTLEVILEDYRQMFTMDIEEILDCSLMKYIDLSKCKNNNRSIKKEIFKNSFQLGGVFFKNNKVDVDKLVDALIDLENVSGVYRLYNDDNEICYIGKSYNLKDRIVTSMKERNLLRFDYCKIHNKADTDIYEIYYISKTKPIYNRTNNNEDTPTLELKPLTFTKIHDCRMI